MKEPRYSAWGKILEFSGLAWWKVKPIDWSKLKPKRRRQKEGKVPPGH